jgi:hypothetical protein
MLYRSLYFLLHDERHLRKLIGELKECFALDDRQLHAIINNEHQLSELPGATLHHKSPQASRRERNLLYLSVTVFTLALIALILSLLAGTWYLSLLFGLLVVGGQLSGYLLGNRIPNAQLDRFRTALSQGDIVLQVDAPPGQVKEVKAFVGARYPESKSALSNWHVGTIGR